MAPIARDDGNTDAPWTFQEMVDRIEGGKDALPDTQNKRGSYFVAQGMQRGDDIDAATVDKTLAAAGLNRNALYGKAVAGSLDEVERLQRMIGALDCRRSRLEQDFDRHRFALSQRAPTRAAAVTDLDPASVVQ